MVGCGDIGIRLAGRLPAGRFQCHGLRRHPEQLPAGITPVQCDLSAEENLRLDDAFDLAVITPVPAERSDAGYRQAYVTNLAKVIAALESQASPPQAVLLVSSTSVYGQSAGEWVDEHSPARPDSFSGQRLLEGEALLRASRLNSIVVRFSGIYGPGRQRLIRQVKTGDKGEKDQSYSNRIHAGDCAGVLAHLIDRLMNHRPVEPLYLASDCEPVLLRDVKLWLAGEMGLADVSSAAPQPLASREPAQSKNKRCDNNLLLQSGYEFLYPTFRDGYRELLKNTLKSP